MRLDLNTERKIRKSDSGVFPKCDSRNDLSQRQTSCIFPQNVTTFAVIIKAKKLAFYHPMLGRFVKLENANIIVFIIKLRLKLITGGEGPELISSGDARILNVFIPLCQFKSFISSCTGNRKIIEEWSARCIFFKANYY